MGKKNYVEGKTFKKKTTMSREKQWKQSHVKGNIVIHLKGMILICVKESHGTWNNDILGQKNNDILNDILTQSWWYFPKILIIFFEKYH